ARRHPLAARAPSHPSRDGTGDRARHRHDHHLDHQLLRHGRRRGRRRPGQRRAHLRLPALQLGAHRRRRRRAVRDRAAHPVGVQRDRPTPRSRQSCRARRRAHRRRRLNSRIPITQIQGAPMSFSSLTRGVAIAAAGVLALGLTACAGSDDSSAPADGSDGLGTLKVGALPVPAGDMLKWISDNLAEEKGITIEWQEFTDYNTPNPALSDGSVVANLFQNTTFLETYNEQSGDDLVSVGEIYLPAAAFYSE